MHHPPAFDLPPRSAATQNLLRRTAMVSRFARFDETNSVFDRLDSEAIEDHSWGADDERYVA